MSNFDTAIGSLISNSQVRTPTAQKNLKLFSKVLGGSEEAMEEFTSSNYRLVSHAVTSLIQRHPNAWYLGDDMFSEGVMVFLRGVKALVKKYNRDPDDFRQKYMVIDEDNHFACVTYLYISVYRAIQRLYEKDSLNLISERQRSKHTPQSSGTPLSKVNVASHVFEAEECDTFREIVFLETILDACNTSQEEKIILESIMYSDYIVAKRLGHSRRFVKRVKSEVYHRFCQRNHYIQDNCYNQTPDDNPSDNS